MKHWTKGFDTRAGDTCMDGWVFHLRKGGGSLIIEQLEIEKAAQGCPGHPKTISALVKNRSLDSLDLDDLEQADCHRSISCGQMLAKCITNVKEVK